MRQPDTTPCRCGSGQPFADCCEPYLTDNAQAQTAEALMRSRYVAYTQGLEPYLLSTWHSTTRPAALKLNEEPLPNWIGLSIKRHESQDDDHAIVEFVARYKIGGRAYRLHETSRFIRVGGRWFYVDGDIHE